MSGKEKLLYLIVHYNNGNYSAEDFCSLYVNTFNLETKDEEFTDDEWARFEQFMWIASRYSPSDEDFINCQNAYNDTETVNKALSQLWEYLKAT